MKKIIKMFLNEEDINEYKYYDFDYNFIGNRNEETFFREYKKFLGLWNFFFYNENRLVTVFNSYEIRLKRDDIKQLIYLYQYANDNNMKKEKMILAEFLCTYYHTINTFDYKQNYDKYQDAQNEFNEILNELNFRKEFFAEFSEVVFHFYEEVINFGIENDIYIDAETIKRMFNNLSRMKKDYKELIYVFISSRKNLYDIIYFDKYLKANIEVYIEFILETLSSFERHSYITEMILEIDKTGNFNEVYLKKIINQYVNIVNDIFNKYKDKKYDFIESLADIDIAKNELYFFLRFIKSLTQEHKEKIYECISFLLRLKRFLISDKTYVDSKMKSHKFKLDFENGYIEEIKNKVLKDKFALYSVSNIDFNKAIYSAIETYAKYPIQSLITTYNINSARQIYSTGIEKNIKGNNNFEKYVNEKGKEYTTKHPELLNKIQEDYYEEFLKYLSKIFIMQQNLVLSILGNENFNKIVEELTDEIKHNIKNDYCIIVGNILFIETNIIKILEKNNLSDLNDGFKNINQLFNLYKEDERITNGLMYLNYILYEKSGLNLRNNAMHGTLISEDLSVPLLVSYSGLIFVSWLLNAK